MTDNKKDKQTNTMTEDELNQLSTKIVSRMMKIQTMSEWYEHVSSSDIAEQVMDRRLDMTEEEDAIGNLARYMTLMNLFEDKDAECIFVGKPNKLIEKYKQNTNDDG